MTKTLESTLPQTEKTTMPGWWVGRKEKTCAICHSKRRYGNPMAKCFECKKYFCFDHIVAGCVNKKMHPSKDEVRDICEEDFDKYFYHTILI